MQQAGAYVLLGLRLSASNRLESEEAYRQALKMRQEALSEEPGNSSLALDVVQVLELLANLLQDSQRVDEAEQLYGQALALCSGPAADHPNVPLYRAFQGSLYRGLGVVLANANRLQRRQSRTTLMPNLKSALCLCPSDVC